MVSDLRNTNNQHLQGIYNGILKDGALESLYGKELSDQRLDLKEIFKQISDNDVSSAEKAHLEKSAQELAEKITALEKKMDLLKAEISDKQEEINNKVEEIAGLVTGIEEKSENMENKHRNYVKEAINDVFTMYSRGTIEKDNIGYEIRVRLQSSGLKIAQSSIESDIINLNRQESSVQTLIDESAALIDDRDLLRREFGATKSVYELIGRTLNQIGNTNTNYTNSDYNTNIPVYSIDKTSIVSDLFDNEDYNVLSTNTAFIEGSNAQSRITPDEIKAKYQNYLNVAATGSDKATSGNATVKALSSALNDENFIDDLRKSSMTNTEIAKFMAENFSGASITCDNNGNVSVPYGHDDNAKAIYEKFANFINNGLNDRYFVNTWDKNQGNTIDSNAQIQALSSNYKEIFKQLGSGEPKYSFKEAMYVLFNKNSGLFKDCGINYDLSQQEAEPTYTIGDPGDEATAILYQNIAKSIKQYWGVDPKRTNDSIGTQRVETAQVTNRTDPLSFITETADGRKIENTFIVDLNEDGKFSGYNEFLGASGNWLEELKTLAQEDENGRMVVKGENLSKLKILSSEYTDNATTNDGKYLHETNNNIDYRISDASKMGIESIDITDLVANQSTGKFDINGSEIFSDGFTFQMNGKEYTASRKDDTASFMDAVYKDATNKSFEIGHSESEIESVMDKNYNEIEDFITELNENNNHFFDNYNFLSNFDQLKSDTKALYDETNRRIENSDKAELTKADNRAMALHENTGWNSIVNKVRNIALEQNINAYSEEVLNQLKGIYNSNTALDAYGVVRSYKEQLSNEVSIEKEKQTSSIAWEVIIKAFREGITTTASEVKEIVASGQASTADEVIEMLKNKPKNAEE